MRPGLHHVTRSRSSVELVRARVSELHGLPQDPVAYVGCTRESLPPGRGVSRWRYGIEEHSDGRLATRVDSPAGRPHKLSQLVLDYLMDKHSTAEELDPTWAPKPEMEIA